MPRHPKERCPECKGVDYETRYVPATGRSFATCNGCGEDWRLPTDEELEGYDDDEYEEDEDRDQDDHE